MCGLFGVVFQDGERPVDRRKAEASLRSLAHRGPDSCDVMEVPGAVLGHTRLSFLDLSEHGRQPFEDKTGRYALVYNGEIYNFKELRRELEARGVSFHSDSDTEVLLYGLIEHGEAFLARLEGMFAFALLDKQGNSVMLGRDRFGIKPLYYAETADGLLFASEIKALRPWMNVRPCGLTVSGYIAGHYLQTAGRSLVDGVKFFPAGHSAYFVPGSGAALSPKPFFEVVDFIDAEYARQLSAESESSLINRCDELLNESVRKHMIADVPIGALCSGGVDSSLILALASKHTSDLKIFHANVVGPHSETEAARMLASHLRLDLKVAESRDADFIELMPEVMYHFESPFIYHPNSVPFLQVSRLVKQNGVKAVLTGEGADEALLGYANLPLARHIDKYHAAVDGLRSLFHRLPWIGEILWRSPERRNIAVSLLSGFDSEVPDRWLQKVATPGTDGRDAKETLSLLSYHLRTLLMRNDRLGMAASLEARFPFLDHDFMRFAVNLPRKAKIHPTSNSASEVRHPFFMTKWILREVAKRYLPPELSWRKKRGFPTNAFDRLNVRAAYFRGGWLQDYMGLSEDGLAAIQQQLSREERLRLLMLDLWGEVVVEGRSAGELQGRLKDHLVFG